MELIIIIKIKIKIAVGAVLFNFRDFNILCH